MCESQIEQDAILNEMLAIVDIAGAKQILVLIRGYIDESYNDKIFLLSALVGMHDGFAWINSDWKKCLEQKNIELIAQGRKPITRFHAAECNSLDGEYDGWSRDEQIQFMQKLIKILGKSDFDSVAFALDLDAYFKFFPGERKLHQSELLGNLYGGMTKFLTYRLAPSYLAGDPTVRITLMHDRCDYDGKIADAFRGAVEDQNFRERSCYNSIIPASSLEVLPLQMADLLCHENFKEAKRKYKPDRNSSGKRRTSLKVMIKQGNFGGGIEYVSVDALRKLKWIFSRSQNAPSRKTNSHPASRTDGA